MRSLKISLIFLSLLAVSVWAQKETPQQIEERQQREEAERARQMREKMDRQAQELTRPPELPSISRRPINKEELRVKMEAIAELNAQFDISDEYRNKYSEFLKQKNTGIVRMFPDKKCDMGSTVTVEELERCGNNPQINGSGSRYSIKLNWIPAIIPLSLIRELFKMSDIYYHESKLHFGNQATQALVTEIGNIDLDEVTLKSPVSRFITDFKPSKSKTEFQQQTKILEKVVAYNSYFYSNMVPVRFNSAYIFRSIAFSPVRVRGSGFFWHKDLIISFKIVGLEDDGSITFIWKKLKEKSAPYIENK